MKACRKAKDLVSRNVTKEEQEYVKGEFFTSLFEAMQKKVDRREKHSLRKGGSFQKDGLGDTRQIKEIGGSCQGHVAGGTKSRPKSSSPGVSGETANESMPTSSSGSSSSGSSSSENDSAAETGARLNSAISASKSSTPKGEEEESDDDDSDDDSDEDSAESTPEKAVPSCSYTGHDQTNRSSEANLPVKRKLSDETMYKNKRSCGNSADLSQVQGETLENLMSKLSRCKDAVKVLFNRDKDLVAKIRCLESYKLHQQNVLQDKQEEHVLLEQKNGELLKQRELGLEEEMQD